MKKILYGKSHFPSMIRENGYYVDKTRYIAELEGLGAKVLTFLRPRRFGKSLFISMLEAYYDINTADQFDEIFGKLYIGKNPTELRNSFPILKFDFSAVAGHGGIERTETSFNNAVLGDIRLFYTRYESLTGGEKTFLENFPADKNATDALNDFIGLMLGKKIQFYLLIDEYDNLANNILAEQGKERYYSLTHGTGFLRTFFATIKAGTASNTVARMFATGVSPLVMSDVTSGFNMDENISQRKKFNEMVGFTQEETEEALDYYIAHKVIPFEERDRMLKIMKNYYDGYSFAANTQSSVHNSTSVLYLLNQYVETEELPDEIIDKHLKTDYEKLKFLVVESKKLNGNFNILNEILQNNQISAKLVRNFSVTDLIEHDKFVSFLYYLGFLTITDKDMFKFVFSIPNEMCREMLWGYTKQALESVLGLDFSLILDKIGLMAFKGEWEQFFKYVFDEYYKNASIRNSIYKEEGVKGFLLAYLGIGGGYMVRSETELNKGYADIYIKPQLATFPNICPQHYLIELKYIKQSEIKSSNHQKLIDQTIKQAKAQLDQYACDSLIPKNVIKIIAITSSSELLHLSSY
jgi:hypothetical protein